MNKISYIVSNCVESPRTGGEFYTKMVIDYLRSKGFIIDVVTIKDVSGRINYKKYFFINLRFIYHLFLKKRTGDIIIEDFYMHPWLFLFNWVMRAFTHVKIIVLVQSFYHHEQKNTFLHLLDKVVAFLFLYPASIIVANSYSTAEELESSFKVKKSKIRVIYPGTDVDRVVLSQNEHRDGFDFTDEKIRLLTVANYEPRKGIHYLIQALREIKDTMGSRKFIARIVGNLNSNPLYVAQLKRLIVDSGLDNEVELLGWKSREEVKELYKTSDIFVFPSVHEGFGMVLVEAMAYGLPIVAYRTGSIPELVKDGFSGILVEIKSIKELAYAIEKLIVDNTLRRKMGKQCKEAVSNFINSWEDVGKKFYEIIRSVSQL